MTHPWIILLVRLERPDLSPSPIFIKIKFQDAKSSNYTNIFIILAPKCKNDIIVSARPIGMVVDYVFVLVRPSVRV